MSALWTAEAMRAATGGAMARPFDAAGVSIDTRTLRPGELFVALVGESGDGHRFVADTRALGAAGAMVHARPGATTLAREELPADAPLLVVTDTLRGLHDLGAAGRARFGGRVVAVTGSVGKTTTKEMLRAILSTQGATHAAEASHNNHWGVPLTLARLPAEAAYCVAEIGMNHPGEIAPLACLVRPHVAVIVSVEAAHIGHMGSLEAIADEKAAILDGLEPGGVAVLPHGHELLPHLLARAGAARIVTFGGAEADAALLALRGDAEGSDIAARIGERMIEFRLGVPGRHMAMNAVAALAACDALGADAALGARALAGFRAVIGRGSRRPILGGAATLLDESYNASSVAIRAALDVLKLIPARRRVAVLGDMRELGTHAIAEHAGLAPALSESADIVHACGTWMRHAYDALPPARRGAYAEDAVRLAPLVARDARAGDAILVKGSLGSRMRLVVEALDALSAPQALDAPDAPPMAPDLAGAARAS